jgi:predicted nucleic acid-binding protein
VSAIVVDASVALKWFVPEVLSAEARQWREPRHELHTLAVFFDIEIGNVLWKKLQRGELPPSDAALILGQLPSLPVQRHGEAQLLRTAFDLAVQIQRTVYDALYLALAIQLGGRMATADQRLYNSVMTTPYAGKIAWVADATTTP